MDSLQGHLLIASQSLLDPNFAQTVVLIAVHAAEGALGLILNRESIMPLQQIWTKVKKSTCLREGHVWQGGPVGGTLMALHDQRELANLIVTDDLFVATELDTMEHLAADEEGQCRFYVGHSGWGPGQLESELEDGSWLVMPATPEHVFSTLDSVSLWKQSLIEVGRRRIQSMIPIRHMPDNPGLN